MNENPYSVGEQLSFNDTNVQRPEFKSAIRGMQLITASLMLGALSFLFVVMFTLEPDSDSGPLGLGNPSVITLAGVAFGVLIAVSHFVVPGIIANAKIEAGVRKSIHGVGREFNATSFNWNLSNSFNCRIGFARRRCVLQPNCPHAR